MPRGSTVRITGTLKKTSSCAIIRETVVLQIFIIYQTSGQTLALVEAGISQTQMAMITVPRGYTGVLVQWTGSMFDSNANRATLAIMVRDIDAGVLRTTQNFNISTDTVYDHREYTALKYPEKTDIFFRCLDVNNANANIAVTFVFVAIANSLNP